MNFEKHSSMNLELDLSLFRDDGRRKDISDLAHDIHKWIFIQATGHELEAAHPINRYGKRTKDHDGKDGRPLISMSGRADWSGDRSVVVCNNYSNDESCDCEIDCECEQCTVCDHCDYPVDECDCNTCIMCFDCDDIWEDCECYVSNENEIAENCMYCKEEDENIACRSCQRAAFNDNSAARCVDTGYSHINCNYECGCEPEHYDCSAECGEVDGEVISPPLQRNQWKEWVRAWYGRTNKTCGNHEHFSVQYMKLMCILMDRGFQEYMLSRLYVWADVMHVNKGSSFFERMEGKVHWCYKDYQAYEQVYNYDKDDYRYRHINYCWQLHKTMEVRVLPAFQDVELAISAHEELGNIVEQWCANNIDSLETRHRTITMEVMV